MKKILFASTALVATAGMAAAELTWSGSGRLGVIYTEDATIENDDGSISNVDDVRLDHRFRLTVNGVTETDGGVKFEGRIRWQADDADFNGAGGTGGAGGAGFAVSTGGLRIDVGHVSDVFDSGDVISWGAGCIGYSCQADQSHNFEGFRKEGFGAGASAYQTVKARYNAGDFTGAASYTLNDTSNPGADESWQIGAGYSFGAHRIGAMYGDNADAQKNAGSQWAIGADGSFGDLSYGVQVGDNDKTSDAGGDIMVGASASYAVSAAGTLTGFVSTGGASTNDTAYGVGYSHSLGGGVSLAAGIASAKTGKMVADAGVSFSF